MIQAVKSGILVLIVPPTLGSVGMIFVVYKKRNQVRRTDSDTDTHTHTNDARYEDEAVDQNVDHESGQD